MRVPEGDLHSSNEYTRGGNISDNCKQVTLRFRRCWFSKWLQTYCTDIPPFDVGTRLQETLWEGTKMLSAIWHLGEILMHILVCRARDQTSTRACLTWRPDGNKTLSHVLQTMAARWYTANTGGKHNVAITAEVSAHHRGWELTRGNSLVASVSKNTEALLFYL